MGLAEAVAELEEEEKKVVETPEEIEDEAEESEEKPVTEEKEEPKVEPPKLELPKSGDSEATAWYKVREADRKREAAERELAEIKAKLEPKAPSKEENYEGHIEHRIETTEERVARMEGELKQQREKEERATARDLAIEGFTQFEESFKSKAPDYEDVSKYAVNVLAASIKVLNPTLTPKQLGVAVQEEILKRASIAYSNGLDPAASLYYEAKQLGYQPRAEEPRQVETKGPSLAKLGENKRKSSGMGNSGGGGKAFVGNDELLKMTNAERMQLTESDWARLEAEAS